MLSEGKFVPVGALTTKGTGVNACLTDNIRLYYRRLIFIFDTNGELSISNLCLRNTQGKKSRYPMSRKIRVIYHNGEEGNE
jgi:hypothetical protein